MAVYRIRPQWGPGALSAMLLAGAVAGCGSSLPTDNPTQIGTVAVFVVDQNGNGVPNAGVTINIAGFTYAQPTATANVSSGNDIGDDTFIGVEAGTGEIFATPPSGYTGGGAANEQAITVTTNQTTQVTLTLTHTAAAASRAPFAITRTPR